MQEDFPAAHSMDSGWFALDSDGKLAHFDTGEGGAMPQDARFATGEAGGDGDRLWREHIAPWIARNVDVHLVRDAAEFAVYALFDTAENARAAAQRGGTVVPDNDLLLEIDELGEPGEPLAAESLAGFVGLAPSLDDAIFETELGHALPIASYEHGDWEIPGHYVRHVMQPLGDVPLPAAIRSTITRMDTSFAENPEIQLADFYAQGECISWTDADLRTGEMAAPPDRKDSWWSRLFGKKPDS